MQYRWLVAGISAFLLLFWLFVSTDSTDIPDSHLTLAAPRPSQTMDRSAATNRTTVGEQNARSEAFNQAAGRTAASNDVSSGVVLYLPPADAREYFQQRMRHIAIRQANALALAALPSDVVHLLADLKFVEAAQLLKQLAEQGYTGADRLLVSMTMDRRPNAICFPYTEIVAPPVPVVDVATHERQLRSTLSAVPADLNGRLAKTEVLFDQVSVLAACSELAIDMRPSLERLAANAGVDDEDRLFVAPFIVNYGLTLPERALDTDGNDRPPYSRAAHVGLAQTLKSIVWQFNDRAEYYKRVTAAAVAAEPYPELFGLAGSVLLDHRNLAIQPEQKATGLAYLTVASERGDRLGLERYGMELMRHAESIEQGYMLSLFARYLNARGCYPGDYLAEWERQYRYIEEYAQAMSPVTLEIVNEKAEKYIKAHARQAYEHLHCRD